MDISEAIRARRSIRKYKDKPLTDKQIKEVLEAGRWAPSGLNNQPWRFVVIKDAKQKDALAGFTKCSSIIKSAPVVIIVCLNAQASYYRDKDLMAIGACIQNMQLQAHGGGLGCCWLGEILNKRQEVERFLNLDKCLEFVAAVTLGYPNEKPDRGSRKPLKKLME